jgi:tetratricopeptide (TPR) repeat protein
MRLFLTLRHIGAVLLLFSFALLLGCSGHRQVQRAERLEDQGKYLEAAVVYEQLLPRYAGQPQKESILAARLGECLLRADHPQEAFSAFNEAVELDSTNILANLRLAQFYIAANAPDRAYNHLVMVLDHQPNQAEAIATLGAYYATIGQVERAEHEFQRALVLEPGRQSAAVALADLYNTAGNVANAREVLTKAAEADRKDASAWLALGRLEEQQGNGPGAEQAYRNAVQVEDSPESNLRLAQFLLRDGKVKEAEDALRHTDGKHPLESTSLADFELNSGHALQASMEYAAVLDNRINKQNDNNPAATSAIAARMIEADLETQPGGEKAQTGRKSGESRTLLARTHLDEYRARLDATTIKILESEIALVEGDIGKATLMGNAAVASSPDSAPAYFVLGEVYKSKGDETDALEQWNDAISHDPAYTPALLALARLAYARHEYSAAEEKAAAVVRHEPANLEALLLYARAFGSEKQFDAAQSIAHRALAVAPQSAQPRVLQGELEMQQGRPGLALIYFEQAILLDPHSEEALQGLTAAYRTGRVTREMVKKLEHTASAAPRSSALMELAGRLYGERGMYEDAARCLKASMEIDQQRATAAMALARSVSGQPDAEAIQQLELLAGRLGGSAGPLLDAVKAQDQKQPEVAIQQYEAAIRRGEYSGVAANNLAWLYAENGRNLDRALDLAKFAHEREPQNLAIMDTLGFVYLARREYSQALTVLKDAVQLADHGRSSALDNDSWNSLRQHLADAYAHVGEAPSMNPARGAGL